MSTFQNMLIYAIIR